jgi:WD repeat-containing protein 23
MNVLVDSNPKKNLEGDTSVMTYRGHLVLQTQISPEFTTGQRYIYTGCAAGRVVSKYISVI